MILRINLAIMLLSLVDEMRYTRKPGITAELLNEIYLPLALSVLALFTCYAFYLRDNESTPPLGKKALKINHFPTEFS